MKVECAECGDRHNVAEWISEEDSCPSCGTPHVVPRLHAALKALQQGSLEGMSFEEVLDMYGLDHDGAANLVLALGASADAAFDLERTLEGWPRSEWRRFIDRTRDEERRHINELEQVLGNYGINLDIYSE